MNDSLAGLTVLGADVSYFTGKLEVYLRLKGIPYTMRSMNMPEDNRRMEREAGVSQIPAVILPDGRWMLDTTKMIQWFEEQQPEHSVMPADPAQRFIALLIEDYADEWLWRPAMHFRWYYPQGANLLSWLITDELVKLPLPAPIRRVMVRHRQRSGYTRGDGIGPEAVAGVEQIYHDTLKHLQAIFEKRPFLLGDKPTVADIGLSGPFFRHFGLDPVPLEIMRRQAPAVFEWNARLWNSGPGDMDANLVHGLPEDLGPLLDDICQHYFPYLNANVEAVRLGKKRFDIDIAGVPYRGARYSRYRVWCLQELRDQFTSLPEDARKTVQALLEKHQGWDALWQAESLPLLDNQEAGLPFRGDTKMVGVNEP